MLRMSDVMRLALTEPVNRRDPGPQICYRAAMPIPDFLGSHRKRGRNYAFNLHMLAWSEAPGKAAPPAPAQGPRRGRRSGRAEQAHEPVRRRRRRAGVRRRGAKLRQNPHRHRRLDLSAVARDFLSAASCRNPKSSNLPREPSARSRSTRPSTAARAQELGGLGGRGAGRLPVRDQGLALLRHPPEAGRRRRRRRQFPRPGTERARAQARADPVDARGAPQVRPRRHRRLPRAAARTSSTASRCATSSSRATTASATTRFFDLCRAHDVAIVFGDDDEFPCIDADTASFAYARLQRMREEVPTGYDEAALDAFAKRARALAKGRPRRLHFHDQRRQGSRAGGRAGACAQARSLTSVKYS